MKISQMKFKKIVGVDETLLNTAAIERLHELGEEVVMYHDFPSEEEEVIRRIGDADCLLVSFRTPVRKNVLDACPGLRYIGMCCTLYDPASCNVDVVEARKRGITVLGVKDYGDEGVVEYVISELVRLLHGFDICYYSRTRKSDAEAVGMTYLSLDELLQQAEIVCTCLPRNNYLLGEREFNLLGNRKILVNTSVGPTFQAEALCHWLKACPNSFYLCDATGMGQLKDLLTPYANVLYTPYISGKSMQSVERLSKKAIANVETVLAQL